MEQTANELRTYGRGPALFKRRSISIFEAGDPVFCPICLQTRTVEVMLVTGLGTDHPPVCLPCVGTALQRAIPQQTRTLREAERERRKLAKELQQAEREHRLALEAERSEVVDAEIVAS